MDRERIIAIDNGALRIEPPMHPGWGRAGVAYGPFTRRNGLAFGTLILNGHNISRTEVLHEPLRMRLRQWMRGSETYRPLQRIRRWLATTDKRRTWRLFRQWALTSSRLYRLPRIDESLAVGWFPSEAPADPLHQGNGLVVHAIIPEGGELWARHGRSFVPTARGIQNLPMYYVVVLRETGAAYYASSLPNAAGLPTYPEMRPLAIDPFNTERTVYAGIHQSVLGEIGFRADTRVTTARVAALPEFDAWYGSAHAADALSGAGELGRAEVGGEWVRVEGAFSRDNRGAHGHHESNMAVLYPREPSGLVHVIVEAQGDPRASFALVWRVQDADNYWCFEADSSGCRVSIREQGRWSRFAEVRQSRLIPNTANALQVYDDGAAIRLYLNNDLIYGSQLHDTRLNHATGVGIRAGQAAGSCLRAFEAHPRTVRLPEAFDLGQSGLRAGTRVVIADDFGGPESELNDRATPTGAARWRRDIGGGVLRVTGRSAARVVGSVEHPCPGRTAYTVQWTNPKFADVEVDTTPPGTKVGFQENGRAGIIFWQDEDNYLILSVFIGDYPAMSIAAFFQLNGFEELYDAVWSNVGRRINLGVSYNFRVVFDGSRFLAFINGEPVLYRALRDVYPECRDFQIHRVGIAANWEWGNDTGSLFERFVARDDGHVPEQG